MSNLFSARGRMFAVNGLVLRMPDTRAPFVIQIDTSKGNGFNSFTLPLTNHTTNLNIECCDGREIYITSILKAYGQLRSYYWLIFLIKKIGLN